MMVMSLKDTQVACGTKRRKAQTPHQVIKVKALIGSLRSE